MKKSSVNDLSYSQVLKSKIFGTSKYPGFQRRIIAALIDCTIASIFLLPLFSVIGNLIYGPIFPQELIGKALKELTSAQSETRQSIDFIGYIKNNPEMYNYFYTNHGFLKMFIEQILELACLGGFVFVFWIYKQSTPGKMFLSMKIVDAKTLQKPTKKQYALRMFGYLISAIPLFLGVVWIAFDSKKQAWHDKIAGTLVIKVDNK